MKFFKKIINDGLLLMLILTLTHYISFAKEVQKNKSKENIDKKVETSEDIDTKLTIKQKELQLRSIEASLKKFDFEEKIARLKEEVEKLKFERELKESQLEAQFMEEKIKLKKQLIEQQKDIERTRMNVEQNKLKYEEAQQKLQFLTFELEKLLKIQSNQAEKTKLDIENRILKKYSDKYLDLKKDYYANPLSKDNVLMVSDRNIKMDGIITVVKANYVIDQINFFNNQDSKKPIFIIINMNYGGSIPAGSRILKAMKTSKAPIYVVVKSYAGSMAAVITTLADKSFIYPEAQMMHHQPALSSSHYTANTTEQEYILKKFKKWSNIFLGKVAKKMGVSLNKFVKDMYKNSPNGDWEVFGDEAVKIKWADKVINGIQFIHLDEQPEKINYTNTKLWKEYFDLENEQDQIKFSKDEDGRPVLNIYPLPGEFMCVKKDSRIIIK